MDAARQTENDQAMLWNGRSGQAWVEMQAMLDQMFQPLEALLLEAVRALPGGRVLDVGCGTGSTTLAIARRLGTEGSCFGIDISEPMLALARARAEGDGVPARFIRADAESHAFAPASFDMIISRLGVMFFDDPVQAFANLRRAARKDAGLRFIAWRSPAENPFMTTAGSAAAPLLPNLPERRPNAPGQFAFADQERVRSILEKSGWDGIEIQPVDVTCTLPEKDLVRYFTRLGPLGQVLPDVDERTRGQIIQTVRPAFDPFVQGAEVRFTAACWMVGAQAPAASGG